MNVPFETGSTVIGMVHLQPLPGSPRFESRAVVRERMLADARALATGGIDGIMVENFGDTPFYPEDVPKHVVAEMTSLVGAISDAVDCPVGVNVLRNDAEAALSVAAATGAEFVRVNVHSGARVTDQGLIEGRAHETLRLREQLEAEIAVFADVDVKHSTALGEQPLESEFRDVVERGLADAVVVSGGSTGDSAADSDLRRAAESGDSLDVPVFAGSGVTMESAPDIFEFVDGAIVGTALKASQETTNPVDSERVRALMEVVHGDRA